MRIGLVLTMGLCVCSVGAQSLIENPQNLPVEKVVPSTTDEGSGTIVPSPEKKPQDYDVITRGIYECRSAKGVIFVDDEQRKQYQECTQIRAPHYRDKETVDQTKTEEPQTNDQPASCSGALIYKGSTYIFSDQEPCPIPSSIFESRKPIESSSQYYQK